MSNRIEKIKKDLFEKLLITYNNEKLLYDFNDDEVFHYFLLSDPDVNKKNLRWILETYINKGFLFEDLLCPEGEMNKVFETLLIYNKNKKLLDINERSLMSYKTLGQLWNSVKKFNTKTGKEEKAEEKEQAYNESIILRKKEESLDFGEQYKNCQIISPKTHFASSFWGKGTRWCTTKENMFEYYNKDAPLLIFIMPDNIKIQLWSNKEWYQFMDESDHNVDVEYVIKHWNYFREYVVENKIYDYYPNDEILVDIEGFFYYHLDKITLEKKFFNFIDYLEKNNIDIKKETFLKILIKIWDTNHFLNNSSVLFDNKWFNNKFSSILNKEDCLYFYQRIKRKSYKYINLKTFLGNKKYFFQLFPKEILDNELYKLIFLKEVPPLDMLPVRISRKEIRQVLYENPEYLCFFSFLCLTYDICLKAVKKDGKNISYVPDTFFKRYQTKELLDLSIENFSKDDIKLKYIPKKFQNFNLCLTEYYNNKKNLDYIPTKYMVIILKNKFNFVN